MSYICYRLSNYQEKVITYLKKYEYKSEGHYLDKRVKFGGLL